MSARLPSDPPVSPAYAPASSGPASSGPASSAADALLAAGGAAPAVVRALADAIPLILWTSAPDGQNTFLNRQWEVYTGQPAADGLVRGTREFVHPDDLGGMAAAWRQRLPGGARAGEDFAFEYRLRHRSGAYRWHLGRVVARRGPGDAVVEWVGTGTDIHDQKLAERALAESNAQLQAIAATLENRTAVAEVALQAQRAAEDRFHAAHEASPNGFQLLRARRGAAGRLDDLEYVYINDSGARLIGRAPADVVGRRMTEVFPHVRDDGLFAEYEAVVETGRPFEREFVYPHDGLEAVAFHVSAVRVGDGLAVAYVDVTQRVRALQALERARAEAARERDAASAANQAKAQFLAAMSHELRTPLNAIGGHVQLLDMGLHGPVTGEQQDALGRVTRAQQHLLGLINDILNYAKLESGRVEYDLQALDVREVVAEVTTLIGPQLAARALGFDVALSDAVPPVWGDREKVRQILFNLLSNAVKFTDPGGRVLVDVAGPAARGDVVFLRVTDTGVGVPPDKQEEIFAPFVQVRANLGRLHEGTGLGLAISRDLARGMGGDLRVRSAPGAGSTFTLTLRRAVDADGRPTERRMSAERRADDERRAPEDRRHDAAHGDPDGASGDTSDGATGRA